MYIEKDNSTSHLIQWSAKKGLWARLSLLPVIVHKVLLEQSPVHPLMHCP